MLLKLQRLNLVIGITQKQDTQMLNFQQSEIEYRQQRKELADR